MEMSKTCGFDTIWLHNPSFIWTTPILWPQLCGVSLQPPSSTTIPMVSWGPGSDGWDAKSLGGAFLWSCRFLASSMVHHHFSGSNGIPGDLVGVNCAYGNHQLMICFPGLYQMVPTESDHLLLKWCPITSHNIHHNAGLRFTHVYSHPGLTLTPSWKSISLGWSRRYCSLEFRCGAIAPLCRLSNYIVMICHDYIVMIN